MKKEGGVRAVKWSEKLFFVRSIYFDRHRYVYRLFRKEYPYGKGDDRTILDY